MRLQGMANLVVGLGSKARIGKDFAYSELKKRFKDDLVRIAFADELKHNLNKIGKWVGIDFFKLDRTPRLKKILRPIMVGYGQLMRVIKDTYWIDLALNKIQPNKITIITDVRFPNEVKAIQSLGGIYIAIDSKIGPSNATEAKFSPLTDALADYHVYNDFTSVDYIDHIEEIIRTKLKD